MCRDSQRLLLSFGFCYVFSDVYHIIPFATKTWREDDGSNKWLKCSEAQTQILRMKITPGKRERGFRLFHSDAREAILANEAFFTSP